MEINPEKSEHYQPEKVTGGLLLFLEHQVLNRWLADLNALLDRTAYALQSKPGDITLLSDMQNLTGDHEKCIDLLKQMQPKITRHFREKYELKLKTIK